MKRYKKIISLILSLIIVFLSFPLISYAEDREGYFGDTYTLNYGVPIPGSYQYFGNNMFEAPMFTELGVPVPKYNEIPALSFCFGCSDIVIDKGDKVTISVVNLNSNILSCSTYANVSAMYKDKSYDDIYAVGTFNNNVCTYVFEAPGNIDSFSVYIYQEELVFSKSVNLNSSAVLGLRSALYNTEDTKTGLLRTILDWLREIRDKISEIPEKLSNAFSDLGNKLSSLGDKIGTFFSNLADKLKEFAENIGETISNWAYTISEMIDIVFGEIQDGFETVVNWFKSIFDWIGNLFTIDKEHITSSINTLKDNFRSRLGGIIDSFDLLEQIILNVPSSSDSADTVIKIPALSFPLNGKNITLINETTFDYAYFLSLHPIFKGLYDLYQMFISFLIYIYMANYFKDYFFRLIQSID